MGLGGASAAARDTCLGNFNGGIGVSGQKRVWADLTSSIPSPNSYSPIIKNHRSSMNDT